jgi:hypothetical protein
VLGMIALRVEYPTSRRRLLQLAKTPALPNRHSASSILAKDLIKSAGNWNLVYYRDGTRMQEQV